MLQPLKKLLVANRGEIAVRVIRAARELGIRTVAVYSEADEGALHVRLADERVALRGSMPRETYLNQEKLLAAAVQSGADSIHPGYGFLAENADFAAATIARRMRFVGPQPEVIALMSDKDLARRAAQAAGVPVVPGTRVDTSIEALGEFAASVGYPVLVKAVAGGSGRGMRIVESADGLAAGLDDARREAEAAFGRGDVIVEKFLPTPRHIEVQIFGDGAGSAVHFGERECSIQRRHQKLVEEAPAPRLHPELRERICTSAVRLAQEVNYLGAGTVEYLVEDGTRADDSFYFLEMNTRIQVEHPVTEMVTGCDLVREQLLVASGKPLSKSQDQIRFNGHAIEFRLYAEDPAKGFAPATGTLSYLSRASGPGVREDAWAESGTRISAYYDALFSKLTVWGEDRPQALERARRLFAEYVVEGVPSTADFHRWLFGREEFIAGAVDVKWLERTYRGECVRSNLVGPLRLPDTGPG